MIDLNKGIILKPIKVVGEEAEAVADDEQQFERLVDCMENGKDFRKAVIEEVAPKMQAVLEKKIKDGIDKGWFAYVYNDNGEVKALEITKKGNRHFKHEARHFLWVERWERLKGLFKRQK